MLLRDPQAEKDKNLIQLPSIHFLKISARD